MIILVTVQPKYSYGHPGFTVGKGKSQNSLRCGSQWRNPLNKIKIMKLFITIFNEDGGLDYTDTVDEFTGLVPRKGETLVYLRYALDDHPTEVPITDVKWNLRDNKVYIICKHVKPVISKKEHPYD